MVYILFVMAYIIYLYVLIQNHGECIYVTFYLVIVMECDGLIFTCFYCYAFEMVMMNVFYIYFRLINFNVSK